MDPLIVLVYTFIGVVILTAIITFLALTGIITLGGKNGDQHHYYLKRLFNTLVIEVTIVAIGAFGVFLANRNEQYAGLKDLVAKTNSGDNVSFPKDTLSVTTKPDSLLQVNPQAKYRDRTKKKPTPISKKSIIQKPDRSSIDTQRTNSASPPQKEERRVVQEKLEATVYATTDNPNVDIKIISIPEGTRYVGHNTVITTRNGDAYYNVELIKTNEVVEAVKITVNVGERSLFGPRYWIGAILQVFIEKEV